jgi:GNAT superfamily N-acetyltransferase
MPPVEPSVERMIEAGLRPLHEIIGEEPVHRFEQLVNPIEEHQARLVPSPCWYLGLLGVDPARQGTGIGSALVRAFLKCAAEDGFPTCLWTTTESNVEFYKRLGFEVIAADVVAGSDLPYWIFRQDP